jgi:hypothetical protein
MTKAVVFAATMLASLGVIGQSKTAAQGSSPAQRDVSTERVISRTGCLTIPSGPGMYVLTESSGIVYTLAGDTSSLLGHSGQEVQVTGQLATRAAGVAGSGVSNAGSDPIRSQNDDEGTIQVTKSKVVSETCQAGGTSENPPPSGMVTGSSQPRLKMISDSPKNIGDDSQSEAGSTKPKGELPQTSTVLPLLGLIGLGSLVAGFFARK